MADSRAVFDNDAQCALLTFTGFLTTAQFIVIAEEAHTLRQKHNSCKQLNNIEDMKVLTQEIQTWLKETWFPKALQTGLKYFAFVIPKNVLGMMSMKNANNQSEETGIDIKYFDNEIEAKKWLKSK